MAKKNINRIKVVLAEKKQNQQMVGRTIRQRPSNRLKMGDEYHATYIRDASANCQSFGG